MLRRSSTPSGTVTCDLSIVCVVENGERVPLLATLRFDPADPMAVTLAMWVGEDHLVEWTFARDLLADGAHRPTGAGDVRVYPAPDGGRRVLGLCLSNPDGHAEFELPASKVGEFIRDTYAAVPAEREGDLIDWEAELGSLFRQV